MTRILAFCTNRKFETAGNFTEMFAIGNSNNYLQSENEVFFIYACINQNVFIFLNYKKITRGTYNY